MLPVEPECDSVMSRQTLIQFSLISTTRIQTDRVLRMHSAAHIFPACIPPSLFPLSLFQPIRHDSTSWLLANSQPEDISCCESICTDDGGEGYPSHEGVHVPEGVESRTEAGTSLTHRCVALVQGGAGPRAIFNSYKDSCQHPLEAAVYFSGSLAFARLSDSPGNI